MNFVDKVKGLITAYPDCGGKEEIIPAGIS